MKYTFLFWVRPGDCCSAKLWSHPFWYLRFWICLMCTIPCCTDSTGFWGLAGLLLWAILYGQISFYFMSFHIYWSQTNWIILVAISEAIYSKPKLPSLMLQFTVASILGYPMYFLMPAMGPIYFFGGLFPNHLPGVQSIVSHIAASAPRIAMPSLHSTWLLLLLFTLRDSSIWHRIFGIILVLGTLLAPLGRGEHYAVDWIVAFPLVLLVRGICSFSLPIHDLSRRYSILTGVSFLGFCVIAIQMAPVSLNYPVFIQLMAAGSVLLPIFLERRRAKAERNEGLYEPSYVPVTL
jgi:hypothetical protein